MAENVLQLQGISKYYYTDASVTQALRKINLEFHMGEFVAITGESGGGKSTLLNIISGLDTFDEGEMYFRGQPTFQFDEGDWEEYRRNQIGFVFQDYSLLNQYTAMDNIVAALMIQEMEEEKAKELAMEYLAQVGLADFAEQRASQLSSGQKQRLSIARALAKNTDIIVADEPTGNLDSETGKQIIQLLEKLSKDKLVIMVTHNYEQAEPYVSRKIRLHDGELVTDIPIKKKRKGKEENVILWERNYQTKKETAEEIIQGTNRKPDENSVKKEEKKTEKTKDKSHRIARFFAKKNMETQMGRAVLYFSFFFITAVVSFLFIGELLYYADDRVTKEYDNAAYLQKNDTRLVARYPDNRPLTEEDQKKLASVKHVEMVDLYDYANDVNYYYKEGKGYEYFYEEQEESVEMKETNNGMEETIVYNDVQGLILKENDNFMKSASCLSEKDLAKGRLPESRNEIVIYSKDESVLDTSEVCYFTADNIWSKGEAYQTPVTVVGLLKKKTDQVYFDYRLCQMLTATLDGKRYIMDYCYDALFKKYNGKMNFIPVIADDLKENQVRVSGNYKIPSTGYGVLPDELEAAFQNGGEEEGPGLIHMKEQKEDVPEEQETGEAVAEEEEETFEASIVPGYSQQGGDFLEMSQEFFQKLYDKETTQASVYISHYGRTDKVIEELTEMGYDVISTYQISATEYIPEKVFLRLQVIGISCLVLLALMILQVLIVRSFMKIKIKDYYILKFMGMQIKEMKRISYLEMGVHCAIAIVSTGIIMVVLNLAKVPFITGIMPYYRVAGILYFVLFNMGLMILTVFFFNRLLRKKM